MIFPQTVREARFSNLNTYIDEIWGLQVMETAVTSGIYVLTFYVHNLPY